MKYHLSKLVHNRRSLESLLSGSPVFLSYCNVKSVGVDQDVEFTDYFVADGWPIARICGIKLGIHVEKLSFTRCRNVWLEFCKGKSVLVVGHSEEESPKILGKLTEQGTSRAAILHGYQSKQAIADFITKHSLDFDVIFLGVGQPDQERIMLEVAELRGATWVVACGGFWRQVAGLEYGTGGIPEKMGLEGVFRHWRHPSELFNRALRYLPKVWSRLIDHK